MSDEKSRGDELAWDFDRAESVFWAVRAFPPGERSEALDHECADDTELRDLVESLLDADSLDLSRFLEPGLQSKPSDVASDAEVLEGTLGRYELIGLLGRGGMGAVYEARDPSLDRRVALKLFPLDLVPNRDVLDRIEHEARLLAKLRHPGIATVYSLEEADGRAFFTQELVPGETLQERVRARLLSPGETVALGADLAEALAYAHRHGVVHRDLKPDNIKLCPDGTVRILDFGVAGWFDAAESRGVGKAGKAGSAEASFLGTAKVLGGIPSPSSDTSDAKLPFPTAPRLGTPGFLSPEHLDGRLPAPSDDLWALGCVLFFAMTGRTPVAGETLPDLLAATREARLDWTLLPTSAPEAMRGLLEQLLAADPTERRDATSVSEELERWSEGLKSSLAPAKKMSTPHNLREMPDRFVGRTRLLSSLSDEFAERRWVSLVALGGSGKTRLAVEFARRSLARFPGGVWFVDLVPMSPAEVTDAKADNRIVEVVARQLSLVESRGGDLRTAVLGRLGRNSPTLLVLDNCEHVLSDVRAFAEDLIAACPELRVLTTSRAAIGSTAEAVFPVDFLSVPEETQVDTVKERLTDTDARTGPGTGPGPGTGVGTGSRPGLGPGSRSLEQLAHFDAVRLFVERARAVRSDFGLNPETAPDVVAICRRVEGLPLAVELAAARLRVMSLPEVRARLDDQLTLLTRGRRDEDRQASLRATLNWSHDLLSEPEQALLQRLATFRGGWTVSLAEEVCGDDLSPESVPDLLQDLVDQSWVRVSVVSGAPRHSFLEVVRQFVEEQASPETAAQTAARLKQALLHLALQAKEQLGHDGGAESLERLRNESENCHHVLRDLGDRERIDSSCLRLVGSMGAYWHYVGAFTEGCRLTQLALESVGDDFPGERMEIAHWLAYLRLKAGDFEGSRSAFEVALDLARKNGDASFAGFALRGLGDADAEALNTKEALASYKEAIALFRDKARSSGLSRLELSEMNGALRGLGNLAFMEGRLDEAEQSFEEALATTRRIGFRAGEATLIGNLGGVAFRRGDWDTAERRYRQCLAVSTELGYSPSISSSHINLGATLLRKSEPAKARAEVMAALKLLRSKESRYYTVHALHLLAAVETEQGDSERAATLLGAAEAVQQESGSPVAFGDDEEYTGLVRRIRESLGDSVYDECLAHGRSFDFERALAFALG